LYLFRLRSTLFGVPNRVKFFLARAVLPVSAKGG